MPTLSHKLPFLKFLGILPYDLEKVQILEDGQFVDDQQGKHEGSKQIRATVGVPSVAAREPALAWTSERAVAGVRVRAPMLEIHTVAAGGGSVCSFDGRRFRVGPDSAGAVPGPACYRRGGPLTVTDCNVVLGKIRPEHFPAVFGPGGDAPIDAGASFARCREIAEAAGMGVEEAAQGFVRIAVDNMANAIKQISIARGHDVTRYTLQCFGGAGGQHACLVADALGIKAPWLTESHWAMASIVLMTLWWTVGGPTVLNANVDIGDLIKI